MFHSAGEAIFHPWTSCVEVDFISSKNAIGFARFFGIITSIFKRKSSFIRLWLRQRGRNKTHGFGTRGTSQFVNVDIFDDMNGCESKMSYFYSDLVNLITAGKHSFG